MFWDTINSDIKTWIEACPACNSHKPYQQKEELHSFAVPKLPWEIVATDIFEFHGKQYLVLVDSYSGWFEVDELSNMRSSTIILKLKNHFSRFGIPKIIYSDSAPNLTSQEIKEFYRKWYIQAHTSSPEYHQSNSLAELSVKRAKQLLSKCHDDGTDFHLALLHLRNVPREGQLGSPAERLQSRKLNSNLPTTDEALSPKVVEHVPHNLQKLRLTKKYHYDKAAKNLPELRKGDVVKMKTTNGYRKLAIVKRAADEPRSYFVESGKQQYRRNRRDLLQTREKYNEDQFLDDYIRLTRPEKNSQNQHNRSSPDQPDRQSEYSSAQVPDADVCKAPSPPPVRRSERDRKQHYQYQHIV